MTGRNQPKVLWIEIWLSLEIPCYEIIFLIPLNCNCILLWIAVEHLKILKRRKEIPSSSFHCIHKPTPSSNIATFHSDRTSHRWRIRTIWVTPATASVAMAMQRGKSHWPSCCSLLMADITEIYFTLYYGTLYGLRILLNTAFLVSNLYLLAELACETTFLLSNSIMSQIC